MKEDSCIDQLTPSLPADVMFDRHILSQRYMGSFQLRLKRPSRLPAFSRQYIKGDPVHLIDWKAYARSDQLIIREERDEASSRVMIVIDASETMEWPERGLVSGSVPSKLEIALRQALHLMFTHFRKGDRPQVVIWNMNDREPSLALNVLNSQDVLSLFQEMESADFKLDEVLSHTSPFSGEPQQFQLSYFLSDLLRDVSTPWNVNSFQYLRVFHLLSSLETELDWIDNQYCYFDESRGRKEFLGSSLSGSDRYRNVIDRWMEKSKKKYTTSNSDYQFFSDRSPIQNYLHHLATVIIDR